MLDQYTSLTVSGQAAASLTYDQNGNLTSDGTWVFAYDAENRLLSATKVGASVTYTYDALGRRQTKTVNGTLTNYLSAGDEEIAEYDGANNLLRRYIPGPGTDQPVAMVTVSGTTNTNRYFHADRQGSILAMADAAGALIEGPYTYDPYGNSASSTAGVPFRYTGRRLDPETGLYYYRARYYSASLGRFLQTDPVGYSDQMNLYAYVHDDSLNNTDPYGLDTVTSCAGVEAADCRVTSQTGQTFSGGTPEENLRAANLAVAPENRRLTAETGNEWGNVFEQNPDGSVTVSVSVSDKDPESVTRGLNELREKTDNPVGDQHTHPGLPPGREYTSTLSEGDVDTADIISSITGRPFTRTIIDGPTGRVIMFRGRPGSMRRNEDGSWQRLPEAPTMGDAIVIGRVDPIPYFDPSGRR